MKKKWRVSLELELDNDKNPCDPPVLWDYRTLLDLHPDETFRVTAFQVMEGRQN